MAIEKKVITEMCTADFLSGRVLAVNCNSEEWCKPETVAKTERATVAESEIATVAKTETPTYIKEKYKRNYLKKESQSAKSTYSSAQDRNAIFEKLLNRD